MDNMEINTVCYATLQYDEPWSLESYIKTGGYEALKKIVNEKRKLTSLRGLVWRNASPHGSDQSGVKAM